MSDGAQTLEATVPTEGPVDGPNGDGKSTTPVPEVHDALIEVMRGVVAALPDETTLGDIVEGARNNEQMAPALEHMTVQELIDIAISRPAQSLNGKGNPDDGIYFDEDGNPLMDLPDTGPGVVRRRADVPDGDLIILRFLADSGPQTESAISRTTKLTSEQVRLILRHLRSKGQIHVEGSGAKRRVKITRNGSGYLRRQKR